MDLEQLSANLSRNVRRLRSLRGFTQARLSEMSGVPRPTIAKLESGSPNPTLSVLARLAHALRVTLEELLAAPPSLGRLYTAEELPTRKERGVELRQLIPQAIPGVTLERMAFAPGARLSGAPHPPGSWEYLAVERGRIQLTTPDERWTLRAGEVVHYRGDATHGYHNPDSTPALAFTLILPGGLPR
ncbi:MAG: XRE family transcriptional regulator [Myxococcales bacterium]|nr:XRE family transcriptional regulator [Myxococcales bacterium]